MSRLWNMLTKRGAPPLKENYIIDLLLANRGITTKEEKGEFFSPLHPLDISLDDLGIDKAQVTKAIDRIKSALDAKEKIVVFGDYDADGITGSAILWEYLYSVGADVIPYLPERFSEGYGLQPESITLLKDKYPDLKVIITVDNGIVAHEACIKAQKHNVDIIITDHHEPLGTLPTACALVHTTKTSGSATAWFLVRELSKKLEGDSDYIESLLELAAIGTIADQLPLLGINRSIVKHGLNALNKTNRAGLLELIDVCGFKRGEIGSYEVGFGLAPRINAMGRMKHAIDSLRLLCTKHPNKAQELAFILNNTNMERQKTVENVILHAHESIDMSLTGPLVVAHESYHEGVIGLAAAKLVEEFYRPAIVFSKGKEFSKASARSIEGFNIVEAIRSMNDILVSGGGHTMAAGFTIKTADLEKFALRIRQYSETILTETVLERKLNVDLELFFSEISWSLEEKLAEFSPFGAGNFAPLFLTENVEVKKVKAIGREATHLKFTLHSDGRDFDGIGFGLAKSFPSLGEGDKIAMVYILEKNQWNGRENLQLRIKDLKIH